MSKLEDLIQKLCPNGVEWKELGEVCEFQNGYAFKSKMFKKSGEKIIRITNIVNGKIEFKDVKYFDKNDYSNSSIDNFIVKKDDILIAMSGATTGKVGINNTENIAYLNQRVGKFIPNEKILNNKFLYHYLLLNELVLYNLSGNGSQENLSTNSIKKLKIPIPPLEIQEEIVHILDSFTELTNELTNELTARKKQYEFYRDSLLTFGDEVDWKKLGDVSEIYDGTHSTPKYVSSGIKFVSVENIDSLYETNKFISIDDYNKFRIKPQKNDVLMTRIGSVGKSSVITKDEPLAYYVSLSLIRVKEKLLPKFIHYYIGSRFFKKELNKRILHTAVPIKINLGDIGKCYIPLPPLSEQERIVSILDKFDSLCNDITKGLPAEIEARKKQYEYYRDKLLTFKDISENK